MAQISYGTITITDTTDIESIKNWYLATSASSGVTKSTSGWTDTIQQMTENKQYLWNYEQILGTGGMEISSTQPVIIGRYGVDGTNGTNGADGNSIVSIDEYYKITNSSTVTSTNPGSSGWQKNTLVVPTTDNKYLWNYQVINYSKTAAEGSYVDARIIGVYGDTGPQGPQGVQGPQGETGLQGDTGISVTGTKEIYFLKRTTDNIPTAPADGVTTTSTSTAGGIWTTVVPNYIEGSIYYTSIQTTYSSGISPKSSTAVVNQGLTDANAKALAAYNTSTARDTEINALQAQAKYFWWDEEGAHVASGESDGNISYEVPTTYKFNALMAPGSFNLRYNNKNFVQLTTGSLTFFRPAYINEQYEQGKAAMRLDGNALTFYKPLAYNSSNEPTAAATLNANGLILSEGGVQAGTVGQSGFIYLSTKNYGSNLTINSHQASNWREIIGTKFGVDADGNLYASNAEISGKITVNSGSDLSAGLSDYSTTSQMNSAIGTATNDMATKTYIGNQGYQNANQVNAIIESKGYALNSDLTTEINQRKAQYGTSSTSASTRAKVVTCANFELIAGNEITVKFSTANTYISNSVQLNVNGKGAKDIWVANAVTSSTNQLLWGVNAYITFKYDGTQFIVIGEPRTWYGASTTPAATAAKTDTTAITGCIICKGAKIELAMSNNNTNTNATLNIQSTGAKNIYYGNTTTSPTVDNGHSWLGTSTATFTFDGQYYRMAGQTVISGDSITTGTIAANRLDVYDASINKISASAIDVASIQIGQSQVNNLTTDLSNKANSSDSNWSISITTSGTPDYITPSVTLVATIYHNGAIATSGFSTPQWYKNGSTTALSGATYANGKSTITVTDVDAYYICTISSN